MAFDPSTATLEFDPTTAKPVEEQSTKVTTPKERLKSGLEGILEAGKRTIKAGPASFLSMTGGPVTQFGHDLKAVGLERGLGWSPNAAEAMAGATDPQALIAALEVSAATGFGRLATSAPGTVERMQALQAAAKGRQIVSRLLPDLDLQPSIKAGGGSTAQTEAMNLITKTNKPQDIVNKFAVEQGKVLAERDALIASNNRPVSLSSVANRAKLILQKDIANATASDRPKLLAAFKDELSSGAYRDAKGNLKPFDAIEANKRKSYLYEETQGLQKKQAKGISIVVAPEILKVKDAFAQALKEQIEQIHPDIQKLNSRWGAIEEAKTAAARLTERLMEQNPDNFVQRAVAFAGGRLSPNQGVAAAVRELPYVVKGNAKSVAKLTGDIEKFAKQAQEASYKSRLKQMERLIKPSGEVTPPTGLLGGESPRPQLGGPTSPKRLGGPPESKTGLLGHDIGAGFLTKEQAIKENPLFDYEIKQKKVIGEPVGDVRSSALSEGGFNKANLKKSVRDKLERFNKRNRIK